MTKLRSFSRFGLSGRMVTDVIVGSELAFVLEGGSAVFCLSQDMEMTKGYRKRKTVRMLTHDPNPWHPLLLLNKGIKVFLFLINIFRKKIDLFS
jgi:hypothetical protein